MKLHQNLRQVERIENVEELRINSEDIKSLEKKKINK